MSNEEQIRRYFDAMERGALDDAIQFWAEDGSNQASGRTSPQRGRQAILGIFQRLRTAFPDRHYQIDDMFSSGDQVVCRMMLSGTFGSRPPRPDTPIGPNWVGVEGSELIPPSASGRSYSVKHIHVFRLRDGLITDHWAARDDLSLLIQLGAIIVPAHE